MKSGFASTGTGLGLFMEFVGNKNSRECFQPDFVTRGESLGSVVGDPKE